MLLLSSCSHTPCCIYLFLSSLYCLYRKENVLLPPVAYRKETIGRGSLRHIKISDKQYDRLRKEVMGSEETGKPARPELEIFTVGIGGQRIADLERLAQGI